ncbi:MAG: RlmE family RNA methyltransferase [Myxococcota bacterium]
MDRRNRQDHFSQRAKRQGYAARSIFKLEEIDRRWRLIQPGAVVLDLGCAPGSWLQYAGRLVGPNGRVIGYDLASVSISLPPHVESRVGDVFEIPSDDLPGKVDVLLSDLAPATMGHHATDALRSAALVERALDIADLHLKNGGACVLKVLEGGTVPQIVDRMRAAFHKVERLRPQATRKRSTELFLIGLRKRVV